MHDISLYFGSSLSRLDKSGVRTPGTTIIRFWATRSYSLVARWTTKISTWFPKYLKHIFILPIYPVEKFILKYCFTDLDIMFVPRKIPGNHTFCWATKFRLWLPDGQPRLKTICQALLIQFVGYKEIFIQK